MNKTRRFAITEVEGLAVEASLSLLKAELNKIEREEGELSEYWKRIRDIGSDLSRRLSAYHWTK